MLALSEILHSKLKFALIALAIGLIVALTMTLSAMSEGLVTGMTGAKGNLDADAVVFQGDTYLNLERSLLTAEEVERVRAADGVAEAYGVGHIFISVDAPAKAFDTRAFGLEGDFEQLPIVEGTGGMPTDGEAIVDETARADGIEVGDTLALTPIDRELTVIGFTENRRYVMAPVFYVNLKTYEDLRVASMFGAMAETTDAELPSATHVTDAVDGSVSVVAVKLEPGVTVDDLAQTLGGEFDVVTPDEAALAGNGMPVMVLAVNGIQVVSFVIGALVIGVFFYITTLHKTGQIAAVKALGASNAFVYRQLLAQILVLVTLGALIGTGLALGAGAGMPSTMAFDPRLDRWAVTLGLVYLMAFVGSLFSLRSILRIDPATALDHAEH
ncbi:MAG: ABC transporter permease [Coriobacteriia bacterium]|nr:ABC transporter permease [Coriobacteriia bacterium]